MATLQAVVLIGGLGTRLGALTRFTPKPLLPVAGRPFLSYLLHNLERFGFEQVVLLAGYQASRVKSFVAASQFPGIEVVCVTEPEPAGTGGAIIHALPHLKDSFLLMNGDSLFDIDYLDLMGNDDVMCSMALREMSGSDRYGTIALSGDRISRFAATANTEGRALINGGVYWMKREIVDFIPATPCSLEQDVFPRLAEADLLGGRVFDGFFIDIGVVEDFERAWQLVPECFRRPAVFIEHALLGAAGGDIKLLAPGGVNAIRRLNRARRYVFLYSVSPSADNLARDERHRLNAQFRPIGAHVDGFLPVGGKMSGRMIEQTIDDFGASREGSCVICRSAESAEIFATSGLDRRECGPLSLERAVQDLLG